MQEFQNVYAFIKVFHDDLQKLFRKLSIVILVFPAIQKLDSLILMLGGKPHFFLALV